MRTDSVFSVAVTNTRENQLEERCWVVASGRGGLAPLLGLVVRQSIVVGCMEEPQGAGANMYLSKACPQRHAS